MSRRLLTLFAAIILIPVAATLGLAQPTGYSLHGKVLDATGAPIAGAKVSTPSSGKQPATDTVTDLAGEFTLILPAGRHSIAVASEGFVTATLTVNATVVRRRVADADARGRRIPGHGQRRRAAELSGADGDVAP